MAKVEARMAKAEPQHDPISIVVAVIIESLLRRVQKGTGPCQLGE